MLPISRWYRFMWVDELFPYERMTHGTVGRIPAGLLACGFAQSNTRVYRIPCEYVLQPRKNTKKKDTEKDVTLIGLCFFFSMRGRDLLIYCFKGPSRCEVTYSHRHFWAKKTFCLWTSGSKYFPPKRNNPGKSLWPFEDGYITLQGVLFGDLQLGNQRVTAWWEIWGLGWKNLSTSHQSHVVGYSEMSRKQLGWNSHGFIYGFTFWRVSYT